MARHRALVGNAADEEQVREAAEKSRTNREKQLDDVYWVLSTKQGRRFYYRILEECGVFRLSYRAGQPDLTAFNEGTRNIGLMLLTEINEACPDAYTLMMKENNPTGPEEEAPSAKKEE